MTAEYCTCATCGYQWVRGTDGSHSCAGSLKMELAAANRSCDACLQEIDRLRGDLNKAIANHSADLNAGGYVPDAFKAICDHNEGCELACAAQRPNERESGGCGYQYHSGARIYSKRCPTCPLDWKIDFSHPISPEIGK